MTYKELILEIIGEYAEELDFEQDSLEKNEIDYETRFEELSCMKVAIEDLYDLVYVSDEEDIPEVIENYKEKLNDFKMKRQDPVFLYMFNASEDIAEEAYVYKVDGYPLDE